MISTSHPSVWGERRARVTAARERSAAALVSLECSGCARRDSAACGGCCVGSLLEVDGDADLTTDDVGALGRLADAGLIPPVQYLGAA